MTRIIFLSAVLAQPVPDFDVGMTMCKGTCRANCEESEDWSEHANLCTEFGLSHPWLDPHREKETFGYHWCEAKYLMWKVAVTDGLGEEVLYYPRNGTENGVYIGSDYRDWLVPGWASRAYEFNATSTRVGKKQLQKEWKSLGTQCRKFDEPECRSDCIKFCNDGCECSWNQPAKTLFEKHGKVQRIQRSTAGEASLECQEAFVFRKQCQCANGTGSTGDDCPTQHDEHCEKCDVGFYLDSDAKCAKNICVCEFGTGSEGPTCPSDGESHCADCQDGYVADGTACREKLCLCDHGTASKRLDCPEDGTTHCADCVDGYIPNGVSCKKKICRCDHGTRSEGRECPTDGAHHCDICAKGYIHHGVVCQLPCQKNHPKCTIEMQGDGTCNEECFNGHCLWDQKGNYLLGAVASYKKSDCFKCGSDLTPVPWQPFMIRMHKEKNRCWGLRPSEDKYNEKTMRSKDDYESRAAAALLDSCNPKNYMHWFQFGERKKDSDHFKIRSPRVPGVKNDFCLDAKEGGKTEPCQDCCQKLRIRNFRISGSITLKRGADDSIFTASIVDPYCVFFVADRLKGASFSNAQPSNKWERKHVKGKTSVKHDTERPNWGGEEWSVLFTDDELHADNPLYVRCLDFDDKHGEGNDDSIGLAKVTTATLRKIKKNGITTFTQRNFGKGYVDKSLTLQFDITCDDNEDIQWARCDDQWGDAGSRYFSLDHDDERIPSAYKMRAQYGKYIRQGNDTRLVASDIDRDVDAFTIDEICMVTLPEEAWENDKKWTAWMRTP